MDATGLPARWLGAHRFPGLPRPLSPGMEGSARPGRGPSRLAPLATWRTAVVVGLAVVGLTGLMGALGGGAPGGPPARALAGHAYYHGEASGTLVAGASGAGAPVRGATSVRAPAAPAYEPAQKALSANAGAAPIGQAGDDVASGGSPRIEETGSASLVVPTAKLGPDLGRLMALATAVGGFVASTSTQSAGGGNPAQDMATLEVPVARFAFVVNQVRALGNVSSLSTSAQDVTSQYVNLQDQITALDSSRSQYLAIMAKAKTIGQVLAVQEQLNTLDDQVQQLQGQLQLMDSETTYATLSVTLSPKAPPPPVRHPPSGLQKAWDSAVSGFVSGVEGVIRVAGPLFFALLLTGALVLVARWGWRRRRRTAVPGTVSPPPGA